MLCYWHDIAEYMLSTIKEVFSGASAGKENLYIWLVQLIFSQQRIPNLILSHIIVYDLVTAGCVQRRKQFSEYVASPK